MSEHHSLIRYGDVKPFCGDLSNRQIAVDRLASMPMLADWVNQALKHGDISQAELSRRLQDFGLRTVDKSAVNKLLKGERRLTADEMLAISSITKFPLPGNRSLPLRQTTIEARTEKAPVEKDERSHSTGQKLSEDRLRRLMAKVFEIPRPEGMTPVLADNLAAAILLVCHKPPDLREDVPTDEQILSQVRALTSLFVPPAHA